MSVTVRDVTDVLEAWAPPGSKLDFDRVGLQVGDSKVEVDRVLVALDLTPAVIDEAEEVGAQLIVTHHPLLFKPIDRVTTDRLVPALAYRLARAGIAYYAIHTNLDAAKDGVSVALAHKLGLEEVTFLEPHRDSLVKLVTFVPANHEGDVRSALAEAGAGRIGGYEACAFTSPGTGHFRGGEGSNPFVGEAGEMESTEEIRLEVEVARWELPRVVSALRDAHPYEEVAYDVYPIEQPSTQVGLGAVGRLPDPIALGDFLDTVAKRLDAATLRYAGDPKATIRTVAVCGGSGSSLIRSALRAGADAYVTADITYHTFFEPMAPDGSARMALIDAGHYETEALTEGLLVDYLQKALPGVSAQRTRHRTSPMKHFVRDV